MEERVPALLPVSREQAQKRVDEIHAFRAEMARLQAEGMPFAAAELDTIRQHHDRLLAALAERFDVDRTDAEKQMSLGMRVASFFGAAALSAAVFLFFYRFWGLLSIPVQIALLVAAPIACMGGVEFAARRDRTRYFASLLAVVGFASFILDLNVLGSIFNLPASPGAFLAWGLFALAIAYGYRLRLMLLAGIACAAVWIAATVTSLTGAYWPAAIQRPENVIIVGLFALAAASAHARRRDEHFAFVYRLTGWIAVLLPLFFLSEWGAMTYLPLSPIAARHLYDVVGFAVGAGAVWVAIRRHWPETLNAGGLFLVLFLCLKLFDWCWDWMPRYLFFLSIAGIAVGLLAVLQRLRARVATC